MPSRLKCPHCGETLLGKGYSYSCPSCDLNIPIKVAGITISESMVESLLKGKRIGPYTFQKKDGGTFKAKIMLKDNNLSFDFSSDVTCPFCRNKMRINNGGAFCECGFKVYRNIAGKMLTDTQLKTLAHRRCLPNLQGFKSRKGTLFQAALRIADDKTVQFVFND